MATFTINQEQRDQLNGQSSDQEVHDSSGSLVGYLVAPSRYQQFLEALTLSENADLDELDRRADEETCTLAEIWKELGVHELPSDLGPIREERIGGDLE